MLHEDLVTQGYRAVPIMRHRIHRTGNYRYYDSEGILVGKTCSGCRKVKSPAEYAKHKAGKIDGISSKCKICCKIAEADRRKNNPGMASIASKALRGRYSQRSDKQIVEDQIRLHPQGTKLCVYCNNIVVLADFSKDRSKNDGLSTECRNCGRTRQASKRKTTDGYDSEVHRRRRTMYLKRTPEEIEEDRNKARPTGKKKCKKCKTVHPLDNFYNDRGARDGLGDCCKPCAKKSGRDLRRAPYLSHWRSKGIPQECYLCGGPYEHVDHVIPLELGGPDELINMLPMCTLHNVGKSDTPLDQWLYQKHPYEMERVLRKVIFEYGVNPFPGINIS